MKATLFPLALSLALAASAALGGEDMYRSVMPDGSVRYGESPAPGAKSVRKIPPPPASTGTITVTPDEKGRGTAPVTPGTTAVIPMPDRPPPAAAEQGRLQAPSGLPKRY